MKGKRSNAPLVTKDQILAARQERYLFGIIHDIFFETGVSDWAAARALYYLGFSDQFYWSAAQSIEKLCKSALLSKWQNVEKYGHDIGKLCKKLSEVSEGGFDLSSYLEKSQKSQEYLTEQPKQTISKFIKRVSQSGHPNSRYNSALVDGDHDDLHSLDQVILQLIGLNSDLQLADDFGEKSPLNIQKDRKLNWPIRMGLGKFIYTASAEDFFLNDNCSFENISKKFDTPLFSRLKYSDLEAAVLLKPDGRLARRYLEQNAQVKFPENLA